MIGIGVFTQPRFPDRRIFASDGTSLLTGSVFPLIMLWIVGGGLRLCGALCYAELATALPRSGGEYNFLSRIYHPVVGFCTGLCSATIGFAAPIAVSALFFGKYLCRALPAIAHVVPNNTEHAAAFILVTVVTPAHLRSLRFTGFFQAAATAMTVLLIIAFVVFGFSEAPAQPVTFLPHTSDWGFVPERRFGSSLIWVMYSYSGWNAAPISWRKCATRRRRCHARLSLAPPLSSRSMSRSTRVFLYTTPLALLSGQAEVAHVAGIADFRPRPERGSPARLICVGLIANVSGMMWVGSRVTRGHRRHLSRARLPRPHEQDARALRGAALPICHRLRAPLL